MRILRVFAFPNQLSEKMKLTVIKIGGKVVDDPTALQQVLKALARFRGHRILVHGGGKSATQIAKNSVSMRLW